MEQRTKNKARGAIVHSEAKIRTKNKEQGAKNKAPEAIVRSEAKIRTKSKEHGTKHAERSFVAKRR